MGDLLAGRRDTTSEMVPELWSRLPFELVEHTLSFLSAPVLCRFRTVSKQWDSLICKPSFRALSIKHARKDGGFIVIRYAISSSDWADIIFHKNTFGENHGWCLFDLDEGRWYTIRDEDQDEFDPYAYGFVAMDGGLACQYFYGHAAGVAVFVSNPIANVSVRLPSSPYHATHMNGSTLATVNILAGSDDHYKVFVLPDHQDGSEIQPLDTLVYDSTTNAWQKKTNPLYSRIGEHFVVECSIFFDGMLYVLVDPSAAHCEQWIWRYNPVTEVWADTGLMFIDKQLNRAQFIVSDSRLFVASWIMGPTGLYARASTDWEYVVYELHVVDQGRSSVFRIPRAEVLREFHAPRNNPHFTHMVNLYAFGMGKSIVVMCPVSGISLVYDLATSLWGSLPPNPFVPEDSCTVWCGKVMNLILPEMELEDASVDEQDPSVEIFEDHV